jgi:hypothetical protein
MTGEGIEAISALLVQTGNAHDAYEKAELNGVYDRAWPQWYAAYAVNHGLAGLVGHAVTAGQLAEFLARTNAEFEAAHPKPVEPWAAWTARRIVADL